MVRMLHKASPWPAGVGRASELKRPYLAHPLTHKPARDTHRHGGGYLLHLLFFLKKEQILLFFVSIFILFLVKSEESAAPCPRSLPPFQCSLPRGDHGWAGRSRTGPPQPP